MSSLLRCAFFVSILVVLIACQREVPVPSPFPAGPIEVYVLAHGALPPEQASLLQPFFTPLGFDVATQVRVRPEEDSFGTFGARGSPTAVGVFGRTIHCISGVLDANGTVRGNLWSFVQPRGIALWAHEIYHVWQFRDHPERFLEQLAEGLIASWLNGHLYSHDHIIFEQEAIAFQHEVFLRLTMSP